MWRHGQVSLKHLKPSLFEVHKLFSSLLCLVLAICKENNFHMLTWKIVVEVMKIQPPYTWSNVNILELMSWNRYVTLCSMESRFKRNSLKNNSSLEQIQATCPLLKQIITLFASRWFPDFTGFIVHVILKE